MLNKIIMILSISICAIFSIFPYTNAELYEDQYYGFAIDVPDGWYIDDEVITYDPNPGYDDGISSLAVFYKDENWTNSIEISIIKDYFLNKSQNDQEYLDGFKADLKEYCETATIEYSEHTCSDYKITSSKVTTMDGHKAYQVEESWTVNYEGQEPAKLTGISTVIPVEDETWSIVTTSALGSDYISTQPQIRKSIESFRLTDSISSEFDQGAEMIGEMFSFFQPITSDYVNSDIGLRINFPDSWTGIQMKFPKEMLENIEIDNSQPKEEQEQMIKILTDTTMVIAVPQDAQIEDKDASAIFLFVMGLTSIENVGNTASSLAAMSDPDALNDGFSQSDKCKIDSSKIRMINSMKGYEMVLSCANSETGEDAKALLYMFGTDEHLVMVMGVNSAKDGTKVHSDFNQALKTLAIDGTVDFSNPQVYSEIFATTLDTVTVKDNQITHDIVIASKPKISDFTYDDKAKKIEFLTGKDEGIGYTDIILDDFLKGPFVATINGKSLSLLETSDMTTNKTILSLSYPALGNKITITQDMPKEIPAWIKNNARWWASGDIDDNSFVQGIQFMIKEKIIHVKETNSKTANAQNKIPEWVKNNAGWWADGTIDDNSFIQGIQFLVEQGVIKVS